MVAPAEHEQIQLLGAFEYDDVNDSLDAPTAAVSGYLIDGSNLGFFTGPWGCIIRDITVIAADLTFTDPAADRYIGYTIDYTLDGGGGYTTALAAVANADLPQIWDDTGNDTEDFTAIEIPLNLAAFHSLGTFGLVIPANAGVRLRIGAYVDGSLADITGLDDFFAYVWGRAHGAHA
jgi:hypothetical protein